MKLALIQTQEPGEKIVAVGRIAMMMRIAFLLGELTLVLGLGGVAGVTESQCQESGSVSKRFNILSPDERYKYGLYDSEKTVLDMKTELIWDFEPGSQSEFGSALLACDRRNSGLSAQGKGWRLPTREELRTLALSEHERLEPNDPLHRSEPTKGHTCYWSLTRALDGPKVTAAKKGKKAALLFGLDKGVEVAAGTVWALSAGGGRDFVLALAGQVVDGVFIPFLGEESERGMAMALLESTILLSSTMEKQCNRLCIYGESGGEKELLEPRPF